MPFDDVPAVNHFEYPADGKQPVIVLAQDRKIGRLDGQHLIERAVALALHTVTDNAVRLVLPLSDIETLARNGAAGKHRRRNGNDETTKDCSCLLYTSRCV